jgi:hypothetical protein
MRHSILVVAVFLLFLSAQSGFSQNGTVSEVLSGECAAFIRADLDTLSGTLSRSSKENIVISQDGKNGLTFVILELDKVIIFAITVVGGGDCIDDKNKMTVIFRDGTKVDMLNNAEFNCDGEFEVFLSGSFGSKSQLEMFRSKEIQSVRVETRKSTIDKTRKNFVEESFTPEQSKLLMKTVDCLAH